MATEAAGAEAKARLAVGVLKALAGRYAVELPKLSLDENWRGRVDALAMRERFSDSKLHASLLERAGAHAWLVDLFEQARVEASVPALWNGVRSNVARLAHANLAELDRAGEAFARAASALSALRSALGAPIDAADFSRISSELADMAAELAPLRADQRAFGARALELIASLGLAQRASTARLPLQPAQSDQPSMQQHSQSSDAGVAGSHASAIRAARAVPRGKIVPRPQAAPAGVPPYHAFSVAHDREIDAKEVCDAARRAELAHELRRFQRESPRDIARWAHRLQRFLQARQLRRWCFDMEEGVLDSSRLARCVADPARSLLFKKESAGDFPETLVTILVDNSGSMQGEPIAMAASCAQILARVLERCGVRTEILGFTTRRWRGGASRTAWINAGRPAHPGRLTDLLHVVYKRADRPWRRARSDVATMMNVDLLKENVDGEALQWAVRRLMRCNESRRILMVICDGAPMDEATLQENDPGYLDRHLREVIRQIERMPSIELFAVGIGHDVGAYYSNAFTLSTPENLGEAMVAGLIDCLRRRGRGPMRQRRTDENFVCGTRAQRC